ncbi:MAG: DUF1552 domain-containing protein [Betaproteobacteria bacterium]
MLAALPFLEALSPTVLRAGARVPVKPPVRFGIYTVTGGTVSESWVPKAEGALGKLPSILRSLEAQKDQLLILSNLAQSGQGDGKLNAHEHCAYLHLTAADKVGKVDGHPTASQSIDERAAEIIGAESLLPAVRMGYSGGETSFFFDRQGRSLPVERNPRTAFERMFKGRQLVAPNWARRLGASAPGAAKSGASSYETQVVDLILEDARRTQKKLGHADQAKLNEYLESVYSVEKRVRRVQERIAIEALDMKDPGPSNPHLPANFPADNAAQDQLVRAVGRNPAVHADYLRIMADLMVLAFQTDTTRVCSLGLGDDGALFPGVVTVGYDHHAHPLEHHGHAQHRHHHRHHRHHNHNHNLE